VVEARYFPEFVKAIKKYSNVKKNAKKTIENLLKNPLGYGEPLKHSLEGLCSCPVKRNFIMIYVYCRECRLKNYQNINACEDCTQTPDEVVKIFYIGPHDLAYKLSKKFFFVD